LQHLFFSLWLGVSSYFFFPGCSDHSPIIATAPSLCAYVCSSRAAPNEVLLILSVVMGGTLLLHYWPLLCVQFFFPFWRGLTPTQVQSLILCIPAVQLAICFTISSL
jgi:hypothetical protein